MRAAYDAEAASSGLPALTITAAVAAGKENIDAGYDIPVVCGLVGRGSIVYVLFVDW